ncbi:MAG: sulfatase family protein [Phycisphaeraceae bacterium]
MPTHAPRLAKVLLLVLAAVMPTLTSAADKPNVVIIYADDIGYGDFGCYGGNIPTPHVDRLAKDGLKFTNGYCPSATCTPSRFAMLTGQYAFRQKGTGIARGDAAMIIEPGTVTLATIMKDAGYTTGVVGKWHLGLDKGPGQIDWNGQINPTPNDIGFDYSFIMAATGDRVPCVYIRDRRVVNLDPNDPIKVRYGKGGNFPGEPDGKKDRDQLVMDWSHGHNMAVINGIGRIGYMTGGKAALWNDEDMADDFAKEAVGFIEQNKDKPFFLFFALHDNHVPRVPHPRFVGKSGQGPRGDAVVQFDWCVGQVVQALEKHGLSKNTLVIVTSDNGPVLDDGYKDQANELLGDHKPAGPLRAGKYSLFEGGTRVPFITSWPGTIEPGTSDALVSQVDFPASLASMTGQGLADNAAPDSFDVLPALLGKADTAREYVVQDAWGQAIRVGDWKYIPKGGTRDGLGPWTRANFPKGALFNLVDDPGEKTNLIDRHPDRAKAMQAKLEAVRAASKTRP